MILEVSCTWPFQRQRVFCTRETVCGECLVFYQSSKVPKLSMSILPVVNFLSGLALVVVAFALKYFGARSWGRMATLSFLSLHSRTVKREGTVFVPYILLLQSINICIAMRYRTRCLLGGNADDSALR
jgi:hypothetical protein